MSFHENPFSVLHYSDGDDAVPVVTKVPGKNPGVKGKHNNQQKQQKFSDQSRLIRVPHRLGEAGNGEMDRGSENGNGFYRFDNGAPQSYNGQSKGGKDIEQHDINEYSQNMQGNGYDNLNEQPPDGDYSTEGGWNFVGEKRGGPQRRRMRSWRTNSSRRGGLNEVVKGDKFFPKPKDSSDVKNVRVGVEGEDTTERITRRNQSEELIKKVQRNMTLKEYEELLIQKRKASEAISPAEEESTLDKAEKPEQCLDKSISMDFVVKLFKRRGDQTVYRNRVGIQSGGGGGGSGSGGQCDQLIPSNEGCSENPPFNINIQDPEQFPCLNVVIKT